MKTILLLGAGRSATTLIQYLLERTKKYDWWLVVGDRDLSLVQEKLDAHPNSEAIRFDVRNEAQVRQEVQRADVVISMLPAHLHISVAKTCVDYKKSLVTASYVSPEMEALHAEVNKAGLLFLNEMGLDPGIDHLSAMHTLDELRREGASIKGFKSYAGGLVSPESDTNPWHYKFTWNPRNVVLAGQGTAQYINQGRRRFVPYTQVFEDLETLDFGDLGKFEGYPNRNSLQYRGIYGLHEVPTLKRGTIRYKGFSRAWCFLVRLGLTEDHYKIPHTEELSYRDFMAGFLPVSYGNDLKEAFRQYFSLSANDPALEAIAWLGLFDDTRPVSQAEDASPAQILQQLLEEKWQLSPADKDMILMQHQFNYRDKENKAYTRYESLIVYGDDDENTAMAKCVGLPLGIATKLMLTRAFEGITGVIRPMQTKIYSPTLQELAEFGIQFSNKVEPS